MKTILISGGSDGLGKATALALSKKYTVIILSNDPQKTASAAQEIGCDFVVADVTDHVQLANAVKEVIAKHGKIDCLINNAGIWIEGLLESNDPEKVRKVIEVNTLGTIFLSQLIVPGMKSQKSGRIINVISGAGLSAKSERSVYFASKWAVTGFTKCLALELAPFNITVNGIYPGVIKTNLFAKAGVDKDLSKGLEVADVVRAIEFLVESPESVAIGGLEIKNILNQ